MANEAVIIELFNGGRPIRYTCAAGTAIAKGTIMVLTTPRTVVAHSAVDTPIVGVAVAGKTATDGATDIAVWTDGIFDVYTAAAGTYAVGALVAGSGTANMGTVADANDVLQNSTIGMGLEAAANNAVCAIRVNK